MAAKKSKPKVRVRKKLNAAAVPAPQPDKMDEIIAWSENHLWFVAILIVAILVVCWIAFA